MAGGPFDPSFETLPRLIPVFPLSGVLLLPGGRLPLNVFEPRYLSMTLDALATGRMIGMIQPHPRPGADPETAAVESQPRLYETGCLGRIISFNETDDGRLQITLAGVCRFRSREELPLHHGYRRFEVDYDGFAEDMQPRAGSFLDRKRFMSVLKPYFTQTEISVNWRVFDNFSDTAVVTAVAMLCPFDGREKQALLEARTIEERGRLLIALIEMAILEAGGRGGGGTVRQ